MRFESVMWKVVVVLMMVGGVGWQAGASQPLEDNEIYEAHDGGSRIPPGP